MEVPDRDGAQTVVERVVVRVHEAFIGFAAAAGGSPAYASRRG